ncbi:hypothetical protein CDG77_28665 [Nostoc sp. 'Peltigera membranacea cyanobiont' 213]|uniref:hypothetical protein n=2 Tax=Nostoc TaxID=1177 RepID=UPI000B958923|nr:MULTISPECIES: hypothetical protein [unclassified Nostoc]AVH66097.1 hypothetical protein NPM_4570 [Nostoc sp. 'Peltigera membranacea cyanobiont' N6]OYD87579.1 hypothetical protein CDG77_28665 [Nostoc sp. 'Peltigera membranacea cyanobiont' 213]OYE05497.1 hypothetical protein CDG79_07465 [Nostoc sp. 'Peltigera membranacea cyanobiont' 232]
MKPIKFLASACRYCRHYQPEGRRGGVCQQLGAPVQATWKACSLALPPFAPSWETLEDAWTLPDAAPVLACSHSVASDLDNATLTSIEEITASIYSEEAKTEAVFI